jgi:hypothetical protein
VRVLLTLTLTAEQLAFGASLTALVAVSLAPTGAVVATGACSTPDGCPASCGQTVLIYVIEADVVGAHRLWPRDIAQPPSPKATWSLL